jgi:hypothetical protein
MTASGPAVMVLGVSRSGTGLLKEMLNHHSDLAIPTESYFIPPLWDRYRSWPDTERLLADLGYLVRLREWEVSLDDIRRYLPARASFADVIQAIYRSYAETRGKRRFGDKTPGYMRHLELLDRVFPGAQYVHIVRDGRNAALSFAAMRHGPRFSWAWPRGFTDFAFRWRREVMGARRFGSTVAIGRYLAVRYEDLIAEPEVKLREVCAFLGLEFESGMLEYHRHLDQARLEHEDHARLAEPPKPGFRDWRKEMHAADVECFEVITGDLLNDLGYERAFPVPSAAARTRAALGCVASGARLLSWRVSVALFRRTPAWRLRQVYIGRSAGLRS